MTEGRSPDEERIRRAAEAVFKGLISDAFARINLDPYNVESTRSFNDDLSFLRRQREWAQSRNATLRTVVYTAIGTATLAVLGVLVVSYLASLRLGIPHQ
jgi:hypothetical protein